jgi:acyl carrier protein
MYEVELTDDARGEEAHGARRASAGDAAEVERIRAWLIAEVAELLSVAPESLDAQEPLSNYGLSSMTGLMLSGEIEEWLGLTLDPAVAWEYPTIESLAQYLSLEVAARHEAR